MQTDFRVVLVTGGSYGIGRGIARWFARRGDAVLIAARDPQRGQAAETEIRAAGGRALFVATDVRAEESIRAMVARAVAEWGRIDVLCNNAGIERYARADEYSIEDFNAIVETNLRGMFLCAKYALPHLRAQRGSIVNVSSVQGVANEPSISVYAGAKAGILGLTRGMAVDFAPLGVRVNAVLPGATSNTGMMENALAALPDAPSAAAAVCKAIPLGRMGEPEDVAGAVYFLASPEASYITGASLAIDGGLLAKLAV
ncbi:MAG: SDR family NAD(P)-dependent oxidoreductase [Bryobacteraceae bacterium]|jgi:NAD(P)-dependent dehydrogenase (short-subunit alcohol dehydrogenase family)